MTPFKLLALAAAVFVSTSSFALTPSVGSGSGEAPNVELNFGSRITHFSYTELCTPADSETAQYSSLVGDIALHPPGYLSNFEFLYEKASTSSQYKGAVLSTNAPVTSTDTLTFTDYEVVFNLALSESVYVYAGWGHHVWNRFLAGGSGYREIYSWDYNPVGLRAWYYTSDIVNAAVDVGLKPTSNGKIKAITSETIAGGVDSEARLGDKTGFKIKLPVVWHTGPWSFTTTPWFEHSEIGQSDIITNSTLFSTAPYLGLEPNSKTDIYGLEVMLGVKF